jgi:hypothetical protein
MHTHTHSHSDSHTHHKQQINQQNPAPANVDLALGDVANRNHQPRMDGSNPKDREGRAGSTHLSEKHREVLCTLSLADTFPASAFGGFDHQRKSYFFCCLGEKDRQTPLEVEQVQPQGGGKLVSDGDHADPAHLPLPASLRPHPSHSPARKRLRGH